MKPSKYCTFIFFILCLTACNNPKSNIPVVGFADAFEDNTIEQAKTGFIDALKLHGFDESKGTVKIIYRNAQGSIPTLTQIIRYFITEKVTLIAANTTLPTITAIQNTKTIPVFMMVAATPQLMHLTDAQGNPPPNLFGVGENLNYIDTSFLLIPQIVHSAANQPLTVGMIFNQSEPQSVEAINRIKNLASANHIQLVALPVNSSADVLLVTQSLLSKHIDAFFANPDNTVFASFENIVKACNEQNVPIFTSEAGLVARGAVAAFGANIYDWGYQAGEQAADFLQTKSTKGLQWQMVKIRNRVYNPAVAKRYHLQFSPDYKPIQ
ncbi:MAG: ABC transporter substrate-binding protein [Sphingobacteriales bacterium]|uniref:ABC transporter substrate-binding protein n=1 Tax=Hydrotalea flava TaxID=714549 RepID=UPI00082C5054|nr:ABC transporter substrate-binding protein [Hydrotalea flava]RTL48004.1 MAG: ABC transporter substrate-binding protein [Sphingobacteriales bacterium]